ncbi:MAG: single-stranded DNA-binding protein [Bacteroidales bacterium]|nr:single-stranded DNA-binding protein [Bacteroidales bacterium]
MASGLNRVTLIGHLGKDPEVKTFENGKNARFTLATNEDYKNKSGEKVSHTEWHNIVVWRGLADITEKYLKKGSKVFLEGRIRNRMYEQDGVKKYFMEIEADNMIMLDSNNAQQNAPEVPSNGAPSAENTFEAPTADEDGLPF